MRTDFIDSFAYFRSRFCQKYNLPSTLPPNFAFALITRQLHEEDPSQYFSRINEFMYVSGQEVAPAEAPFKFLSRISGYINEANPLSSVVLFHNKDMAVRSIWLKGLLQPYRDIADPLQKDMPIATLVLSVRDQGAVSINLAQFPSHATAMRAFFLSRRHLHSHLHLCLLYTSPSPRDRG